MIVRLHNYLKLRLSEQNECRKLKASHNCYGVVETETFEYSYYSRATNFDDIAATNGILEYYSFATF